MSPRLAVLVASGLALAACGGLPEGASSSGSPPPPRGSPPLDERIDVELIPHQVIPLPGLGVTAELREARRGHTQDGRQVVHGVVRLSRGDEVVDHTFDKDGPFEALGSRWAVWGGGAQLSWYPEGVPIHP